MAWNKPPNNKQASQNIKQNGSHSSVKFTASMMTVHKPPTG